MGSVLTVFQSLRSELQLQLQLQLDRKFVLRTLGTTTLVYIFYRSLKFIYLYLRWFKFYNDCQGVKDFSWKTGNLHLYPVDFEKRAVVEKEWMKKYPKYYRIWIGPFKPLIRLYHPDTIKSLIKSTEPKGNTYDHLLPWLGEGLLIAKGQRWSRARRLLTPAFHFEILKPYVNIVNDAVDTMIGKIDKHVKAGTSFELFNMISLCTFEILLKCAMSMEENIQQQGSTHPYLNAVNRILELFMARVRNPAYSFDFIYNMSKQGREFKKHCDYVHKVAENIIEKRQESLEKEGPPASRYLDFLDILLSAKDNDGNGLTKVEIRNEVDTFLFAGHDTTTSGISWALHTLATRPDIQVRIQEELDEILRDRKSKHITWNDIPKLEYLNRCLKEAMRHNSPVPSISRRLERDMNLDGKVFPAGSFVGIGIWHVHHNPDVWEDPEKYDPDRFLQENIKKKDHFAYIPFSAGPRNCIGQHFALNEEKVTIGRILQRYELIPDESHVAAHKGSGILKSKEGLWLFAKHRNP